MEASRPGLSERIDRGGISLPTRGNRKLEKLLEAANADGELAARWYMQQVTSERLGMSDHSRVHIQIVANIALRILRLAVRGGIVPGVVTDHGPVSYTHLTLPTNREV